MCFLVPPITSFFRLLAPPSVSVARPLSKSSIPRREAPGIRAGGGWTLKCIGAALSRSDRGIAEAGSKTKAWTVDSESVGVD